MEGKPAWRRLSVQLAGLRLQPGNVSSLRTSGAFPTGFSRYANLTRPRWDESSLKDPVFLPRSGPPEQRLVSRLLLALALAFLW